MGVKSYVAGLQAEAVGSVTNALADGLSYAKRVKEAKDKTDINRESIAVQGKVENFIKDLEYDRDWQKYPEKLDEQFANLESYIDDNDLLSGAAKKQMKEDILPQYKVSAQNSITSMQTRSQMAEINVELEGFRSILSSDTDTSMNDALGRYRDHLADLGIYNEVTVSKMTEDFRYSLAPSKAVQALMKAIRKHTLKAMLHTNRKRTRSHRSMSSTRHSQNSSSRLQCLRKVFSINR